MIMLMSHTYVGYGNHVGDDMVSIMYCLCHACYAGGNGMICDDMKCFTMRYGILFDDV